MNAADKAIEEVREVRRRISADYGHDIAKYLASLRAEENQHADQLKRGQELLAQRRAERRSYPTSSAETLALRDQPKA